MTLEPGQSKSQTVKISYGAKMVNTNVNKDQRGTLILDKIMVKRLYVEKGTALVGGISILEHSRGPWVP